MRLLDKLVVLTVGFFTLLGFAQQPKDAKATTALPTAIEDINSSNVVDYIASKVKVYDKNPVYAIRPLQNSCVYEILVNGYLIHKNYDLQKLGTPIPINAAILKSGTQTITYRLYPLEDLMVNTYGKGDTVHTLLKNTSMNIEIIKYEDIKTGTRIGDEILVVKHESLTKKGTREFIGSGLPYYEYTFTFEATVPYEIESWSNGQDLTKYDKEELEAVVLKKYAQIKKYYQENNVDKLIQLEFLNQSLRQDISDYKDKELIQEYYDNYINIVTKKDKRIQPLESYEMQFFGNNKIVTFRHPVISPRDPRLKGKSAFYFLTTLESGRIIVNFDTLFLYLPKGKALTVENLQIL
ncbi:hypothetical protein M666_15135 [Cellulophaga baltica 18]|uniref:DUF3857 domain-containing protein n=2 Tax=Cellulophaga baltica TaxID=76594 RepID=A0AAU8RHJ0_9FLAO|nr:hypothetical protein M666_15135 [Cellulophaga baltica 18]